MKCLDTNWIIELFGSKNAELPEEELIISRISYVEFLSSAQFSEEETEFLATQLKANFQIRELGEGIGDTAASLRRQIKGLSLGDALVMATAINNGAELLTHDKRLNKYYRAVLQEIN